MCSTSAGRSGLGGKEIVSWPQLATKVCFTYLPLSKTAVSSKEKCPKHSTDCLD